MYTCIHMCVPTQSFSFTYAYICCLYTCLHDMFTLWLPTWRPGITSGTQLMFTPGQHGGGRRMVSRRCFSPSEMIPIYDMVKGCWIPTYTIHRENKAWCTLWLFLHRAKFQIMSSFGDQEVLMHPHSQQPDVLRSIVKLFEVFEDQKCVYMVMDRAWRTRMTSHSGCG